MATYATRGEKLEDCSIYPESIMATCRRSEKVGDAGTGLSTFWKDCPMSAIRNDPGIGYMMEDDFVDLGLSGAITTIISSAGIGRYLVFGGNTETILPDYTLGGGIVLLTSTSNQAVSITTKQTPFQITSGYGSLWFEGRFKFSTITTNHQGWFIGLMDTTAQDATHPLTNASALADQNLVGFHKPEANTTAFDTSYRANGVAAVEVNSDVGTLTTSDYFKLGMKFDTSNNVLSFYIDGVVQATAKTIPNATGTDFPADVTLAPVVAAQGVSNDDKTITMDWWKCAQLYI